MDCCLSSMKKLYLHLSVQFVPSHDFLPRSEQVFFLFWSQVDFSLGDSCVSTATGQFLLPTDFS
jgi:hypothetical protein